MKRRETFGKLLVLLLALFSLGSNLLFADPLPQFQEDRSPSEETIKAAHICLWATRENIAPEFSEASEYNSAGNFKDKKHLSLLSIVFLKTELPLDYRRDIRKSITSITFPTHFFL